MSRDGMISPGTERYFQGRNDMSRDGAICSGKERGAERNETERGAERNDNIEKR